MHQQCIKKYLYESKEIQSFHCDQFIHDWEKCFKKVMEALANNSD